MRRVGYAFSEAFLNHEAPWQHPERKERLIAINERLRATGLLGRLVHLPERSASRDDLLRVHNPGYVDYILNGARPGLLDGGDTFFSEGSKRAALLAAGAPLAAIDAVREGLIDAAFCAVRPPGHHAERDEAMGFCIFNNVAVGARYAQTRGYPKIFIIDFDVHHGNGTQHIFENDPTVFYFSSHQYPHYPGTGSSAEQGNGPGKGYTQNAPMSGGTGDREYRHLYRNVVPGLIRSFAPDMVLVSAGYDIHERDPLSGIRVSTEAIGDMVSGMLEAGPTLPWIFCLEGGYDLTGLAEGVEITLIKLLGEPA